MHRRQTVLEPRNVDQALPKIDLVPPQTHQFGDPKTVAVGDEDQSRVAKTVAPLRTRGGDLANLFFRQIFPVAILGIWLANGDFPVYDSWSGCGGVLRCPVFLVWAMRSFRI